MHVHCFYNASMTARTLLLLAADPPIETKFERNEVAESQVHATACMLGTKGI